MKILSLRFKNINSLKGEWKINFDQEPLLAMDYLPLQARQVRVKPRS
ncbi:hypothetical protein IC611_06295 [Proteus mirabilis]